MKKPDYDPDAIPFLSDALAVRNAKLPWWASNTILWMSAIFLLFLLWACIGHVDVIVSAHGKLVSNHPTLVMKPLERTVIKRILVAVGDRVRADQELVLFDPIFSRADRDRLAAEVQTRQAKYDRLVAEFSGREYAPTDIVSIEADVQKQIFENRREFYTEKEAYFKYELQRIERSRRSITENLEVQRKRLKGFRDIEHMVLRGHAHGSTSHREFIESQIARQQMEAEIGDKEHSLRVLESEFLAKKAEYNAFCRDWLNGIADEMVKEESELIRARKELAKAEQMTTYVALRAPEDAVVHEVGPISPGSAVREAETIITLVPIGGELEVDAEISANDIGKVHEGDHVRVKISAFPFQKYGTISGVVRVISEDAFTHETKKQENASQAYYRARIRLTDEESSHFKLISRLIPGMEVQAEIRVGTRSIIRYFTDPLVKSLDEAIREP